MRHRGARHGRPTRCSKGRTPWTEPRRMVEDGYVSAAKTTPGTALTTASSAPRSAPRSQAVHVQLGDPVARRHSKSAAARGTPGHNACWPDDQRPSRRSITATAGASAGGWR